MIWKADRTAKHAKQKFGRYEEGMEFRLRSLTLSLQMYKSRNGLTSDIAVAQKYVEIDFNMCITGTYAS